MKQRPNFIIGGAQKSGTTWLVDVLRTHSNIFLHRNEIHFFEREINYNKGIDWYEDFFKSAPKNCLIGEKTPDYLPTRTKEFPEFPNVAERIFNYNPNIKLIFLLRNPVKRAISAANHMVRTGRVSPFMAIDKMLNKDRIPVAQQFGVLEYGNYSYFLKEYLRIFPKEQLLVLEYEEIVKNKPEVGAKLAADFLGISANFDYSLLDKQSNKFNRTTISLAIKYYAPLFKRIGWQFDKVLEAKKKQPMAETIQFLENYYQPEIQRLSKLNFHPKNW